MPKPKAKPKAKPDKNKKLSQKERFIQAAREAEADETGETFELIIEKIVPQRND